MRSMEFLAKYKIGNQQFTARTTIAVRNIQIIQDVPAEVPEHLDGMISRVEMPNGISIFSAEKYEDLIERYTSLMAEEA